MLRRSLSLFTCCVLSAVFWAMTPGATHASQSLPDSGSANRILVRYQPGTSAEEVAAIENRFGAKLHGTVPDINVRVLELPSAAADHVLEAFHQLSDVDFAERDGVLQPQDVLPNDPSFPQTYAVGGGAWGWRMTHTTQAWDITEGDPSVVIAILDTGIKMSGLTDFNGQIASMGSLPASRSASPALKSVGSMRRVIISDGWERWTLPNLSC